MELNIMLVKELQRRLNEAQMAATAASLEKSLALYLKSQAEIDAMIGEQKYSKGAYALRLAYAEQAYRNACSAERKAEDEYMAALEREMGEIRKEASIPTEDLLCRE